MTHRRSRRGLICEAALDLAAQGGNHALTHQGVDARLGLARGSTSYYYRTRLALVSAAIGHLTERSRERFHDAVPMTPPATSREAAVIIATQLEALFTDRRRDILARYALVADAMADSELHQALARCLFSTEVATELMDALGAPDPGGAARNLVSLLEGLVFTHVLGAGSGLPSADQRESLRATISMWIDALVVRRNPPV